MVDRLPIGHSGETRCFLVRWHETIAPVVDKSVADIGFSPFAFWAFLAFGHPYREHFVSGLQILDVTSHTLHKPVGIIRAT